MIAELKPYPAMKDSGVPWLGKVPKHWGVASVKRHYAIQLGKMLQNRQQGPADIETPYLKAQHVQWFSVRTSSVPRMWASPRDIEQFGVAAGDLLVCEGGEGGRSGIVRCIPSGVIIQNALHRVRPRDACLNEFLQYEMSAVSATGWFDAINNKATIAHFTREKFGALGMPVPPLPEQAAIVRFLDHANRRTERYIRAKKKLTALLNEQKQVIIHRAVTRGLDSNVRLKASGLQWLAHIPEHWEVRRNGQLFVQRNQTGFPELPILEVSLNTGVRIRDIENSTRKQMMSDRAKYKRAARGDIAYNMMRMWQGAVGVCPVDGLVSPAYVVARPLDGTESRYYSNLFRTRAYMGEIDSYSRGIVKDRNRLYWEDFKQIASPYPPAEEQVRIADAIEQKMAAVTDAIAKIEREITLLREYRTRLIADVVTGKLDVREAAAKLPDEADKAESLDEVEALDEVEEALNESDLHNEAAEDRV
jgi:type I restriction enzyme S subunit